MTARVEVRMRTGRVRGALISLMRSRLERASTILEADTRRLISSPYPPASRPGQPPHRRTGRLQASVDASVTTATGAFAALRRGGTLVLRLRATAFHAGFLERGTRRMAARPFLRVSLRRFVRDRFRGIITGGRRG